MKCLERSEKDFSFAERMYSAAVAAYYTLPLYAAGGPCHIVLDDNNYRDEDIEFCIGACKEKNDWFGEAIMRALLAVPFAEREKFAAFYYYEEED